MTTFLMTLSFIVGAWLGWRYENLINDFVEHFKSMNNKKDF
jgi:uncharacterized membrane protein required for colicin V production